MRINEFNAGALNPYINYHRPCLYPSIITDKKGKEKKQYLYEDMMTPYDKLKSIESASSYLKDNITFEKLDDIEMEMTDNEAAKHLQEKRKLLFNSIHQGMVRSG